MFVDRIVLVTVASASGVVIPWERFPHGMDLDYVFVMLAWSAGFVSFVLLEKSRSQREALLRSEVDAHHARLSVLASQLNPHFLFNSLNTIRSLAAEDPSLTRDVVTRLSSFLRRVLSIDPMSAVSFADELELAADYLSVEKARFEKGLDTSFNVDPTVNEIPVPPLILQPLLENAIKHGSPGSDGVLRIAIDAAMRDGDLVASVSNTGSLAGGASADGVGLNLTKSRLEQMFGRRSSFALASIDGRTVATIRVPAP
jgi:LytS/YehU family sensor histidine kinase